MILPYRRLAVIDVTVSGDKPESSPFKRCMNALNSEICNY